VAPLGSVALLLVSLCLSSCAPLGPTKLGRDELDYSRALGEAQKREMLLNIVRIRYADPPTFLDTTQVIAGYQLQRNASGGLYAYPGNGGIGSYLFGSGSIQTQESPTFTYQPVTGEQYAENIIRPIAPVVLLPLSLGGLPIDMLLRLTAQSIAGLSNVRALSSGEMNGGSIKFYLLLRDLRALQMAGALSVRLSTDQAHAQTQGTKSANSGKASPQEHVYLVLSRTSDRGLNVLQNAVRQMLHLPPNETEAELVYGPYPIKVGQIAVLTRSMLGVLSQLAYQMDVPQADIDSNRTLPTIDPVGIETRPDVAIHYGKHPPKDSYAAVEYHDWWFWIENNDFRSKLAFTMVQVLAALAATSHTPGAIITIPAG
jgi:hypothetical protein